LGMYFVALDSCSYHWHQQCPCLNRISKLSNILSDLNLYIRKIGIIDAISKVRCFFNCLVLFNESDHTFLRRSINFVLLLLLSIKCSNCTGILDCVSISSNQITVLSKNSKTCPIQHALGDNTLSEYTVLE
jgi:hypothetical protein